MLRVVSIGDRDIEYTLTYKKVKNINLRVKADCSVSVSAPPYVDESRIDEFVLSKGSFVLSAIDKFKKNMKLTESPKKYVSGESFRILGNDLRLKVLISNYDRVYSDGVFIYMHTRGSDLARKQRLFNKWISGQINDLYHEICRGVYRAFEKYGIKFPVIKIRKMVSKWGSCQPSRGVITLNSKLIEYPRICIEYVVMHEFCHFIHPNHSKDFYTFLSVMMPDWKYRKDVLESKGRV